jgi:hypothetical protein
MKTEAFKAASVVLALMLFLSFAGCDSTDAGGKKGDPCTTGDDSCQSGLVDVAAGTCGFIVVGEDPALDPELFPNTPPGWFWSSTSYTEDDTQKWVVNVTDGRVIHSQLTTAPVRCVRDM